MLTYVPAAHAHTHVFPLNNKLCYHTQKCNHAETFGWLLDGFPRTGDQVDALEAKGLHPDLFILLQVPDKDLVARVINRRMDPTTGKIYSLLVNPPPAEIADSVIQREDDTEVAIVTRKCQRAIILLLYASCFLWL